MNIQNIQNKIEKEKRLSTYAGEDRLMLAPELKESLEKERQENGGIRRFNCNLPLLDELTRGFTNGNLVVLGGYPGEGKSTFARTLTKRFIENGTNCLWFTFEETEEEFLSYFGDRVPEFYIPKTIKEKTIEWIDERIIESKVNESIPENKRPKIIFIDNLEAIKNTALKLTDRIGFNEASLYAGIVQSIKNLAIDYKLVIFLLVNSNRSEGKGRQAILDDTSYVGSQQVAHIADICWSIWRRKDKGKDWDSPAKLYDEAILNISKNRGLGRKCGVVKLKYDNGDFSELQGEEKQRDDWAETEKIANMF